MTRTHNSIYSGLKKSVSSHRDIRLGEDMSYICGEYVHNKPQQQRTLRTYLHSVSIIILP